MVNRLAFMIMVYVVLIPVRGLGFDGHEVQNDRIRLVLGEMPECRAYDVPILVPVEITNTSQQELSLQVQMGGLVEPWYGVGALQQVQDLAPGQTVTMDFRVAVGRGAYDALYPVHVYATIEGVLEPIHAVRIVSCRFPPSVAETIESDQKRTLWVDVPRQGCLPLLTLNQFQVAWYYQDQPAMTMARGWEGSDSASGTSFTRSPVTRGGVTHRALGIHPPWRNGRGSAWVTYWLRLPEIRPLHLIFAHAIRDHSASEPPSDGVTFRVWVDDAPIYKQHSASKEWVEETLDLSDFAGRDVALRLESHPGPKWDTTCDSSYWAMPTLVAGALPVKPDEIMINTLRQRARELVAGRTPQKPNEYIFALAQGYVAGVVLGEQGLIDGVLALGRPDRVNQVVTYHGIDVSVRNRRLGAWPPQAPVLAVKSSRGKNGQVKLRHDLGFGDQVVPLTVTIEPRGPGLSLKLGSDARITDLALGATDQKARRVYYGHGYCIEDPQAFSTGFGGHNLSTSHVGFDFEKGLSVLMACDYPPDRLEVDPARRIYTLRSHMDATLTLVPSTRGAFDAALRYRDLDQRKPSPGFTNKAGRFVFDIWGGAYADNARWMDHLAAYGLTDALLTLHVWQRWGYDYRLPDIYPPNPQFGTLEDLQELGRICDRHGILWGLHDNYIDFYPDAEDYSYEHICFTETGQPVRAWFNEGRQAQSYRWRPDRIMPFVQRNINLIKQDLKPTHSFLDVFTSIGCFDYYDHEGTFHSMLETRRCWGETFRWIQDNLGGAVTTSEAGHDQLVGYLDGSDCQFLRLTPDSKRFCVKLNCADWERVPWFDAVLHDRFSLHGVGYSGRYQSGRSRLEHGIESDDYLTAEILTGHALMIDRRALSSTTVGRGAIRKYWLAQALARHLSQDRIQDVAFADDNIHRQVITWANGTKVYVNRGEEDWPVAGRVLPQYGFYASSKELEASIERREGIIVEQSSGPGKRYVNARGYFPDGRLPVTPRARTLTFRGNRRFELVVDWDVVGPIEEDLMVFVHFVHLDARRSDKIAFQGDLRPAKETSHWRGRVTTGAKRTVFIPLECQPGFYDVLIGLWDPQSHRRFALNGQEQGDRAYRLGTLELVGSGGQLSDVRLTADVEVPVVPKRWNPGRQNVSFDAITTSGACRLAWDTDQMTITPLPKLPSFTISVDLRRLRQQPTQIQSLHAIDRDYVVGRSIAYELDGEILSFKTDPRDFAYKLVWSETGN